MPDLAGRRGQVPERLLRLHDQRPGLFPPVSTQSLVKKPPWSQIITFHSWPSGGSVVGSASGTTLVVYAHGMPPLQK